MTHHMEEIVDLHAVALGRKAADLVIRNARVVNVHTREILDHAGIAIAGKRIAYVGACDHLIGENTQVIDAQHDYVLPGFIDAHMHVESSMLNVTEFAKIVIPHGTTAIVMDPHEIGNIFGIEGVRQMHEEGASLPLKVYSTIPSCVPAQPLLEDAGNEIGVLDVLQALTWDRVLGLSEVMDVRGILTGEEHLKEKIAATHKANKKVTGHLPVADAHTIAGYIVAGIDSDHECTKVEEALIKARLGMLIMIREGSAWQDVKEISKLITEYHIDPSCCVLVTDDVDAKTLVQLGHMNHVVRRAIEEGIDPLIAIQMATLYPAKYFRVDDHIGSLAPGKSADLMLVHDIKTVIPHTVFVEGKIVAKNGKCTVAFPRYPYPKLMCQSIHILQSPQKEDFIVRSEQVHQGMTTVRVIRVIENHAHTEMLLRSLQVQDRMILPDVPNDILYLSCIERHHGTGEQSMAFVHGFGLHSGAVASSVAHDSHHLLVMGTNTCDMAIAVDQLNQQQGGMVVVNDGHLLASVELPIAGLMSDQPADIVCEQLIVLERAWRQLGCVIHAPFMTFSLLALPVIPALRLTPRGLVDVVNSCIVPLEMIEVGGEVCADI